MNYILTKNNLHIDDSWQVRKKDMKKQLYQIRYCYEHPENICSDVWLRTYNSLISEWVCHNALYRLGLWRSRTKDVDLDYPCDKPECLYKVCAAIVWPFVK